MEGRDCGGLTASGGRDGLNAAETAYWSVRRGVWDGFLQCSGKSRIFNVAHTGCKGNAKLL